MENDVSESGSGRPAESLIDVAYSAQTFQALSQVWQAKLTAHLSSMLSGTTDVLHQSFRV